MTAEEVKVVRVAEEEVVASSSSKVDNMVEKDEEKEKKKEDLSNGANGRTVKEDTNGGGSYVFVNGNDAVNNDSMESDLEKSGNCIGGEDQGVENSEIRGELKSDSNLVRDLGEEESCTVGIVDQDKKSIELCLVEVPFGEHKSRYLVENGPVTNGVSETSSDDQNGVSESPEDVSDGNGDGSANGIAKRTVLEAAVVDSSKQSDEVSSVSVSESNGGSLAADSVQDNAVNSWSKENEDSEMAVADARDCNGDSLANESAKDTIYECAVESEDGIPAVSDRNGDGLPTVSEKDTVVLDSRAEQNDGAPVSDSDGDGLPADTMEDTLSQVSKPEQNESSSGVGAEADCLGPVCNGNGDRPVQNGFSEMPETVLPDVVSLDEIPVEGELDLEHNSERDLSSEADTHLEKETGRGSISDECGEALLDFYTQDGISEVVINDSVDSSQNSQGQSSEIVKSTPSLVTNENVTVERVVCDSTDSNIDTGASVDVVESSSSIATVKNDTVESGVSNTAAETLPPSPVDDEKVETEVIKSDENSRGGSDSHHVENSEVDDEKVETEVINSDENSRGGSDSHHVENSEVDDEKVETEAIKLDERGGSDSHHLENSEVDDEKVETEVIKSDENSRGTADSHHVENSEIEIEVESGSLDDDTKSSGLAEGLKSETKISSDSIVPEEAEDSKGLAKGDTDEKLAVADGQNDSSLAASLNNDEKASAAVENLSAVTNRDISGKDGFVNESICDTQDNEENCAVIKGGIQFGSVITGQEGVEEVERKRPFYFMIRVPRFDDENLKEKIRLAQIRVDEKTQSRDAIRIEMQSKRATCKEYGDNLNASISEEKVARDLHRSKCQEIESIQSVINIEDIDVKIRNMEHMIQHETMPLKDEKQFIREIKQLKQNRERLSSNTGRQDEVKQGLGQKDQIEEHLKSLKKEADQLKVNLLKAEAVTKAAKKKYHDETEKLSKLVSQFKAADNIRQEAYAQLQSFKKQAYEKNKYFWQYRDHAKAANDLTLKGDREALQNLCVNQVEKLMNLWNSDDEFRKEYMTCNVRSTLRRLRTLDGRALGPDEEPPVVPQVVNEKVAKDQTVSTSTSEEQTQEKVMLAKAEKAIDKSVAKAMEQKNQTSKSEKSLKSVPPASGSTTASSRDKIEEAVEEKPERSKEEEEAARKAEELRREEEAAKLREQRRLEEMAKAKEALERKRRIAEKAQARAVVRAQKEAEQKEKEREKRAKKMEKRKVAAAAAAAAVDDVGVTDEMRSVSTSENPAETPKESKNREQPATVAKRPQKPSQFTKQTKAKSIPPPLRNRGKRRMQPWMWVILTSLLLFALFLVGNFNFPFNFGLTRFKF